MAVPNVGNEALGMLRMTTRSMTIIGALAIALSCYAQKPEPIPSDMVGTPGTIVGFVRDTACLLRNKNATVAKDEESRKCIMQCVRAESPLAILTKSGELYTPLSAPIPDRDERRRLLPYAGKYVRATGRLFERGGTHAISIEKIEVVYGLVMPENAARCSIVSDTIGASHRSASAKAFVHSDV
jgi:hypothetical protein